MYAIALSVNLSFYFLGAIPLNQLQPMRAHVIKLYNLNWQISNYPFVRCSRGTLSWRVVGSISQNWRILCHLNLPFGNILTSQSPTMAMDRAVDKKLIVCSPLLNVQSGVCVACCLLQSAITVIEPS